MSYFDHQDRVIERIPRSAFKPSPIFVGIVAVFVAACTLAWLDKGSRGFNIFLMVVGGWLISLCLHEFAHAVVAYKAGDVGVAHRGYLQLNPLKYAHWLLSIALPLLFIIAGGIALPGGAVAIDHRYIRSKWQDTAISVAGPAVNLVAAGALAAPFAFGVDINAHPVFWSGAAYLALLQLMAGIFNILPIPGLDGGNAILPWLPRGWQNGFNAIRPYGFLIVFLVLWQTSLGRSAVNGLYDIITGAGVPNNAIYYGQAFFRFWTTPPATFPSLINF